MTPVDFALKHNACAEGMEYAKRYATLEQAWKAPNFKPEYRVWACLRPGVLDSQELKRFAIFCAGIEESEYSSDQRKLLKVLQECGNPDWPFKTIAELVRPSRSHRDGGKPSKILSDLVLLCAVRAVTSFDRVDIQEAVKEAVHFLQSRQEERSRFEASIGGRNDFKELVDEHMSDWLRANTKPSFLM